MGKKTCQFSTKRGILRKMNKSVDEVKYTLEAYFHCNDNII